MTLHRCSKEGGSRTPQAAGLQQRHWCGAAVDVGCVLWLVTCTAAARVPEECEGCGGNAGGAQSTWHQWVQWRSLNAEFKWGPS
jgi:hypothetical protein